MARVVEVSMEFACMGGLSRSVSRAAVLMFRVFWVYRHDGVWCACQCIVIFRLMVVCGLVDSMRGECDAHSVPACATLFGLNPAFLSHVDLHPYIETVHASRCQVILPACAVCDSGIPIVSCVVSRIS